MNHTRTAELEKIRFSPHIIEEMVRMHRVIVRDGKVRRGRFQASYRPDGGREILQAAA